MMAPIVEKDGIVNAQFGGGWKNEMDMDGLSAGVWESAVVDSL